MCGRVRTRADMAASRRVRKRVISCFEKHAYDGLGHMLACADCCGGRVRNLVHVDDVAKGHLLAYEKGSIGEKYILGGQNLEFSQILAKIAEITGGRCPKIKLPHNFILPIGAFVELWARIFGNSHEAS